MHNDGFPSRRIPHPSRAWLAAFVALAVTSLPALAPAATEDHATVIVILPPRIISGDATQSLPAAEAACEDLAVALQKLPNLRIVDRSQLDRVLKERQLTADPATQILSYDAIVSLEIDTIRPLPQIHLALIDLTDGNPLVQADLPWSSPLPADTIRALAQQIATAAAARPTTSILRVRLLEVANPAASTRLDPLAQRFRDTFAASLTRSPNVRLIHHLEAPTAKEESLLLFLGHAQLAGGAGGRQFAPQTDATVELQIRESQTTGKTFAQTPVKISWRITKASNPPGPWSTAAGTVATFDALLQSAWKQFAQDLGRVPPQAAADTLHEMFLRRAQAQAELDAAPKLGDLTRAQWRSRLAHVAAAAKLDPAWELPAYLLVEATANAERDNVDFDFDARDAAIHEAYRYLQRFDTSTEHRREVLDHASFYAWDRFVKLRDGELITLSAHDLATLDVLQQLVNLCVTGPPREVGPCSFYSTHLVYRGMRAANIPPADRRLWLTATIHALDRQAASPAPLDSDQRIVLALAQIRHRLQAIKLMLEEQDAAAARQWFDEGLPLLATLQGRQREIADTFRDLLPTFNDSLLVERFNATVGTQRLVFPMTIHWPEFSAWGAAPPTGLPRVKVQAMRYDKYTGAYPLATIGDRMYVFPLGAVPLDRDGRPAGGIERLPALPKTKKPLDILSVATIGGKLYLGTRDSGLLEYDPAHSVWRTFGPAQGLPDWTVNMLLPQADGTLLVAGGSNWSRGFLCQVDPKESEVKALLTSPAAPYLASIQTPWLVGNRLVGLVADDLLELTLDKPGLAPVLQRRPAESPANWKPATALRWDVGNARGSMAVIAGKRFMMARDALRQVDDHGTFLRTWWVDCSLPLSAGSNGLPGIEVVFPTDLPVPTDRRYESIVQDESHLFFPDSRLLCFDPIKDIWYGPLEREPYGQDANHAVPGVHGIWMNSGDELVYLDTADFLAAAKTAGRVITGEELHRRRAESVTAAPPREQAKWALSMHEFEKARTLATAVLAKTPADAEMLLLMAILHEPFAFNEPDKTLGYYRQLAAVENNDSAAFTGLLHQCRLHLNAKRYPEALAMAKAIQQRYPRNTSSESVTRLSAWLATQIPSETFK